MPRPKVKRNKVPKSGRRIGYARVSTKEQNLDLQVAALKDAGCFPIHEEKSSGTTMDRTVLNLLIETLKPGDTIVVWKLDRFGRTVPEMRELIDKFEENDVYLESLTEHIDSSTSSGKFIRNIYAAVAENDQDVRVERIVAGIAARKAKGLPVGRKKGVHLATTPAQDKKIFAMLCFGHTCEAIGKVLGLKTFLVQTRRREMLAQVKAEQSRPGGISKKVHDMY